MFETLMFAAGAVAGVVFAAWRLRGDRSVAQALRIVVPFAGGGPIKTPPR